MVSEYAISGALIWEEEKVQRLVKVRPYFHSHTISALINYPLRQVLQKPDAFGHLLKWAIELSQFDIEFIL